MVPTLGIPTLCRYDLLEDLIRSAESGSLQPSKYIIIDNGGRLDADRLKRCFTGPSRAVNLEIVMPGTNMGVAASWNSIIDRTRPDPVVISNDDVVFGHDTFATMTKALMDGHLFVEADGWALFGQSPELVDRIGYYDENFWPAYYEDVDYDLRMARAGVEVSLLPERARARHSGWATLRELEARGERWLTELREKNHQYFLAKWGGESRNPRWNGNPGIFQFEKPFNGNAPNGWNERTRLDAPAPMHWDVLNYVSRAVGKKLGLPRVRRYLEIGIADGTCARRIEADEKWGVDPNPLDPGVRSVDFFVPKTSFEFFEQIPEHLKFDLIFIDGYHDADVVYSEVKFSEALLSHNGAICLHDSNPMEEYMQMMPHRDGLWTGNVWKAVTRLRSEGEYLIKTVGSDYGTTIIFPANGRSVRKLTLPCEYDRLQWKDLAEHRERFLGLLDPNKWRGWIDWALTP